MKFFGPKEKDLPSSAKSEHVKLIHTSETERDIYTLSYSLLKPLVEKTKDLFAGFDLKLKIARIDTSPAKYGAYVYFIGLLTFIITFVFITLIGTGFSGFSWKGLLAYFGLSLGLGAAAGALTYVYPDMIIAERRTKIDNTLGFVAIYLSTIAKSGFPPQHLFRLLSDLKQYGAIALEARKINSDVYSLGLDLPTALTRAMKRSPSPSWTELLAGMRNSITVGGDLGKYLEGRAEGFIQDYRRRLDEYSKLLSLLGEAYITAVIVGTVFFVVIASLMAAIGGFSVGVVQALLYIIVFLGLPGLTAGFVLLAKSLSPWSD